MAAALAILRGRERTAAGRAAATSGNGRNIDIAGATGTPDFEVKTGEHRVKVGTHDHLVSWTWLAEAAGIMGASTMFFPAKSMGTIR